MTVAYESGVASSPADLVSKLGTLAAANGWTVSSATTGVVFRNGDINVGVHADASTVYLRGALGYDSGAAWNAQPGTAPDFSSSDVGAGPFTAYHAWVGDEGGREYLHCAIEITSGMYRHFVIGQIVPYGAITGGVYVDAVYWHPNGFSTQMLDNPVHRFVCSGHSNTNSPMPKAGWGQFWCDYDSKTDNWQLMYNNASPAIPPIHANRVKGSVGPMTMRRALSLAGAMKWNLRTPLSPMEYMVGRSELLWSAVGRIPHMRQVSLANYAAADEISVGGETWKVFPIMRRNAGTPPVGVANSDLYGYAYLMPDS